MIDMEYYKRLDRHFNRGLDDGMKGVRKPGFIVGSFRKAYLSGNRQGIMLRKPTDFKIKK